MEHKATDNLVLFLLMVCTGIIAHVLSMSMDTAPSDKASVSDGGTKND